MIVSHILTIITITIKNDFTIYILYGIFIKVFFTSIFFWELETMKLNLNEIDYDKYSDNDDYVEKFEPIPVKQNKHGESDKKHSKRNKQLRGKEKNYDF